MYNGLTRILEKPPIYTKSEAAFWDDQHISKCMLEAHLDPEFEGASRKMKFIKKSIEWISDTVPPLNYPLLLDVGCGPGLYAEGFAKAGYQVTGIDFSKRSVKYAAGSAMKQGLDITYVYQNYLEMNLDQSFDLAVMIYCDYGALSIGDRKVVMKKIFEQLKPGGKFLLDVFSMAKLECFEEKQTWEICRNGGFWSAAEYFLLNGCYRYPESVTLEQFSIILNNQVITHYLWNTYFTKERLIQEATAAGFKCGKIFGDVAGSPYKEEGFTIGVLLEK